MNLFEIDKQLQSCVKLESGNFVDTETGEVINTEAIEQLEMDKETKLRNIGCWILNLDAEVKSLAEQEKRFKERKEAAERKIESLKTYVGAFLDGKAWKCTECEFKFRTSESVQFNGKIDEVPIEYLRYKEPELDKKRIKTALKNGIEIKGCMLEKKTSVSVK